MAQAAPKQHPYHPPVVCYAVENLPQVNTELLQRLAEGSHELVREFEIPPRDGRVSWVGFRCKGTRKRIGEAVAVWQRVLLRWATQLAQQNEEVKKCQLSAGRLLITQGQNGCQLQLSACKGLSV